MDNLDKVKEIFTDALGIGERKYSITAESNLLGSIPELDSMGVVSVITALAEHFDITINDDEINAKTFETLGSLVSFVEQKLAEWRGALEIILPNHFCWKQNMGAFCLYYASHSFGDKINKSRHLYMVQARSFAVMKFSACYR